MIRGRSILILGDSHVAGPPGKALEALLYTLGAADIHRIGVVGWGATDWVEEAHVADRVQSRGKSPLVIFWLGTNDSGNAATGAAMAKLGAEARAGGAAVRDIWWVGPPSYRREDLTARGERIAAFGRELYGSHFIDSRLFMPADDPGRTGDGVHVRPGESADRWAASIVKAMADRQNRTGVVVASVLGLGLGAGIAALMKHFR